MQDKPARWVQATLLYFGFTNAFPGVWALFMPRSFYDSFPGFGRVWVSVDGPYNQHLIQDVGGFFLALSVLSFLAFLSPRLVSARATAICLLTFNLPHLLYHLKHLHMLPFIDQVGNVVTLSLAVLLLIPLLLHQPRSNYVPDPLRKMNKVLVIGGSGVLGSAVVNELQRNQVNFLTGSRHQIKTDAYSTVNRATDIPWQPVDLITGEGLPASLAGVDTVLHLASGQGKIGQEPFEVAITRNLLKAVKRSDVTHLIHISIVGIDKIPFSYYKAKLDTEALIRDSQVPYTILRATQFHDFVAFNLGKLLSLPIGFVPKKLLLQPIDLDAVVQKLHQITEAGSQNTVLNLGGPRVYDLGTLARIWMQYRRLSKPIIPIPILGSLMNAIANGNATCPEKAVGSKTWEEYLANRYGALF